MNEPRPILLPIVLGPTGSGKSELGLRIAAELGGEIVNCDSLQVYRGFDIGTAKVPIGERRGIPHHLIDIVEPAALFTAGDYLREARAVLEEIAARGRIPVVVGGTGFYLRALLEGLFAGPGRDEMLRLQREQRRPGGLHRILSRLDHTAASRIHPNDKNKTIRALEVRLLARQPMSTLFTEGRPALTGFIPFKIGLHPERSALYARLDARTAAMFERGLITEVQQLLARGVPREAKPFESLGYKQTLLVLDGQLTVEQAIQSTQMETRHYAKRQVTWFRKEADVLWLDGFGDAPAIQTQAAKIINAATKKCESCKNI